jgi:hypothetical protein
MKYFFLLLIAITPFLASAADPQVFSGISSRSGPPLDCAGVPAPSQQEAQADADQQASKFCAQTQAAAKRVSEFTLTVNNCVWGGPQYHIPSDTLIAQASYVCANVQPTPSSNSGNGVCQHAERPARPYPECAIHAFGCCGGCWCD